MQMVMFTKVNGITTKLKVEEPTSTLTAPNILVIGKKIGNMDTESSLGQIMPVMRATTSMERSTILAHSNGLMAHHT